MEENRYRQILNYSRKFCSGKNIDYMDLAHDVLVAEELEITDTYTCFRKAYGNYWSKELHFDKLRDFEFSGKSIEYKYCYHCNEYYPLDYFIDYGTITNYCKNYRNVQKSEKAKKDRIILSDRYIKQVISKSGQKDNVEVVRDRIIKRRTKTPQQKRTNRNDIIRKSSQKGRENLADWYVSKILSKHINRSEITKEMIVEKRQEILHKRNQLKAA